MLTKEYKEKLKGMNVLSYLDCKDIHNSVFDKKLKDCDIYITSFESI